jgi:hypothetical protein
VRLTSIALQGSDGQQILTQSFDGFPRIRYDAKQKGTVVLQIVGPKAAELKYRVHTVCNKPAW